MKLSVNLKSQLLRAVRVFAATFATTYLMLPSTNAGKPAIVGGIVAAVEVAVRTVWPSVPAGAASGLLGAAAGKVLGVTVTPIPPVVAAPTITPGA